MKKKETKQKVNNSGKISQSKGLEGNSLYLKYKKEIVGEMMKEFGYKGTMAVPRLKKIVVNTGIGPWLEKEDMKKNILKDMTTVTGQKPVFTKAKQAVAGFKIKEGQEVGVIATLRGRRMYDFLERLIVEVLPRVKDFRGIPVKNFGEKGNLSFGLKEHTVFAEIDSENIDYVFSLQVNIVNNAQKRDEGIRLIKLFGFPINEGEETGVADSVKMGKTVREEKKGKKKR